MKLRSPSFSPEHLAELQRQYEGGVLKTDIMAWQERLDPPRSHTWNSITHMASNANPPWRRPITAWMIQRRLGPPPKINPIGGCLIFADAHVPAHDANWMNRIFELAYDWGIRRTVSNGDLFNLDSMTRWQRQEIGFEEEQKASRTVNDTILERFEEDIILGNHCLRVARETGWRVPADVAVRDFLGYREDDKRVHIHRHKCAVLYGAWRVEHSKRSSMMACQVAHNLCAQYRMNVATSHAHVWGMIGDISGRNVAVDTGHCADVKKLDYTQRETFGRTQYSQGALILQPDERGIVRPWLLHPVHTDFAALSELAPHFRRLNRALRDAA